MVTNPVETLPGALIVGTEYISVTIAVWIDENKHGQFKRSYRLYRDEATECTISVNDHWKPNDWQDFEEDM